MERMIRGTGVYSRYFWLSFFLAIITLFLLISCTGSQVQKSPTKGVYHVVKKGETAYSIARAYSIDLHDLAEINNIIDASNIKEGSVLFIPDADQIIDDVMASARNADAKRDTGLRDQEFPDQDKFSKPADLPRLSEKKSLEQPDSSEQSGAGPALTSPPPASGKKGTGMEKKQPTTEEKDEVKSKKDKLMWPVRGTVKTRFGVQPNKTYHNWIKITCAVGTPVRAAAAGTVIFSSTLPSFGETIIVRHSNGFATVYTHLKNKYVQLDQSIKKGQAIALVGEIDKSGEAYINFEIRLKNKPRDPLLYLP